MRFLFDGYRRLLTHPRYGMGVVIASLLYLISPIDLSPDILPLLGQIDDVVLIVLMLSTASQWLSQRVLNNQREDAIAHSPLETETIRQTIDVDAIEVDTP